MAETPTPTKTQAVQQPPPTGTPIPAPPATATPIPANLAPYTGLPLADPSLQYATPILVCLNNDVVSRSSHYGLNEADVTFEYIVDGFLLTRITSVFQSIPAQQIGPVRSARWPNIHTTYMFDGILVCSGGSDGIRYLLKNEVGFPYLDADTEDEFSTTYFYSVGDNYRTRLRTSVDRVRLWVADTIHTCQVSPLLPYCLEIYNPWVEAQRTNPRPRDRASFSYGETPPDFAATEAATINIPYPEGNGVEWRYDPGSGRYLRFNPGVPTAWKFTTPGLKPREPIRALATGPASPMAKRRRILPPPRRRQSIYPTPKAMAWSGAMTPVADAICASRAARRTSTRQRANRSAATM